MKTHKEARLGECSKCDRVGVGAASRREASRPLRVSDRRREAAPLEHRVRR
ncbi:MAG: hypothetical protein KME30_04635 [Iphinoe sp. HA4291-MV1]|nr:hypothetical protein [Iphinoe sp. HA4291-MV1]